VPLGGADEQGPPVRAAEHQRERRPVLLEFDALQDRAALGDAGGREPARAHPHRAFGVQADAVRSKTLGEDPPPRQPAIGADAERGEPAANDSEMISVRPSAAMTMPLGKAMSLATWRSCRSGAGRLVGLTVTPWRRVATGPMVVYCGAVADAHLRDS
jgi:hypothetical protein